MASQHKKEQALILRQKGKSISDIAKFLRVSKSTTSYWCRDITLSQKQQRLLDAKQKRAGMLGRLRAAELKRAQRIQRVRIDTDRGSKDVGIISSRDMFCLGLALYWGEGYKSGNEECGLTNSDPAIIIAFITWLKQFYDVSPKNLILRVSINETHTARRNTVEKYWSDVTGIPLSQFTTTSFIRTQIQKKYANIHNHFGTLRVKVRKGTSLRRRIMGSLATLKKEFTR